MSDTLTEDEDIELIEVDEIPTGEPTPPAAEPETPEPAAEAEDDDDDDDGEDERLAESQDDLEDEVVSRNRKKRQQRRQLRKAAQERTLREIQLLREQNEFLMKRVSAVEGNALDHNALRIDEGIQQAKRQAADAEEVMARAVESGSGEDLKIALRMREDAIARVAELEATKRQVVEAKSRPSGPDPDVKRHYDQWTSSNPWFDPEGADPTSKLTRALDAQVAKDGYDPKTPAYWQELTRRVSGALEAAAPRTSEPRQAPPARKPPPMGNSRETATVSSKTQVYVTPERKRAMEESGVWGDPVRRNRMLKYYQEYDRNNAQRA